MPFSLSRMRSFMHSYPRRIGLLVIGWLVLISLLHISLNSENDKRPIVKLGYMPVITNLAAPLLDAASAGEEALVRFKAVKFASFAEMAEAFRNDQIHAAFIIAPLSIVLHQQEAGVRVVYIGNRHESTFVVRKNLYVQTITDLAGSTIAVPLRYSGHNLALLKMIGEAGMEKHIRVVEMNPPDMASALAAGALDAYIVGEPFAAQTLKFGQSNLFMHMEKMWPDFICNLMIVKQRLIEQEPETVQLLVQSAARSGVWARQNIPEAARIASQYWGQPVALIEFALNTPEKRIIYDKFLPKKEELQRMADMMKNYGLIRESNIEGLVEDRFALRSNLSAVDNFGSILKLP